MNARRVLPLFLPCVLALLAAPALALDANGPTWRPPEFITNNVCVPGHFGADRVLEYDHWGNPGVAIDSIWWNHQEPQWSQEWLGYWRRSALGWQSQWVDWRWFNEANMGMYPSLAYDRYERPSISYHNDSMGRGLQMQFAHWDNFVSWWTISADQDPLVPSGKYTSLAYDAYGRPAVAFQSAEPWPYLKYWYDGNTNFYVTPPTEVAYVCTQYLCGYTPTLAFDNSNRPWIAHLGRQWADQAAGGSGDPNNFNLLLTMQDPGVGWRTTILEANVLNTGLSLAINPRTGQPAVVYQRQDSNLIYREFDGAYWNETVLTPNAMNYDSNGCEPSLAFDPGDGNPAVAYVNWWRDLMFTWYDGNSWQSQRVDGSDYFANPSLAFNEYGTGWPGIAYFGHYNGNAYFVEDPQFVPEPAAAAVMLAGAALLWRRRRR